MGCKCPNSNYEEYEINNKELSKLNENFNIKEINNNINDNYENINQDNSNLKFNNSNNSNDFEDNKKQNEYENQLENHNLKYLNYPEKLVEIINNIRQDPFKYSKFFKNNIKYKVINISFFYEKIISKIN